VGLDIERGWMISAEVNRLESFAWEERRPGATGIARPASTSSMSMLEQTMQVVSQLWARHLRHSNRAIDPRVGRARESLIEHPSSSRGLLEVPQDFML